MSKTKHEMQMQAYGAMQSVLRKTSQREHDLYANSGEGRERHLERERQAAEIEAKREKEIKQFLETKPRFSYVGLTDEQAAIATATQLDWDKRYCRFLADLNRRLPKPVVHLPGMVTPGGGGKNRKG